MKTARLLFCLLASPAAADVVLPTQVIRAKTIIMPHVLTVKNVDVDGMYSAVDEIAGQEARVTLYPGRPIKYDDVGPPALIERNAIVPLLYSKGGLSITAEGRSLSRAGAGESVRVMNLSSRTTVTGHVLPDGTVEVSQ